MMRMKKAAKGMGIPDASDRLFKVMQDVIEY